MSGENSMAEPRPAASLTANLLARRGAARPAMRRPSLAGLQSGSTYSDDLGWNDMGHEPAAEADQPEVDKNVAPVGVEAPVPIKPSMVARDSDPAPVSPAKEQMLSLAEQISLRSAPRKTSSARPASLAGEARKAAFTLRLDTERHLRLRLLSAVSNRSAQQLLVEALDEVIARNAKVQELAEQVETQPKG